MTNDTFPFCQLLVSKRGELQAELVLAGRREEEVRQERRVLEKRCREANGEVLLLKNRLRWRLRLASISRSCRPGRRGR